MLEFIAGSITGIVGALIGVWFTQTEKYRLEVFRKKYEVYQLIQDKAFELYACGFFFKTYEKEFEMFEKIKKDTVCLVMKSDLIISDDVFAICKEFISVSIEEVLKNRQFWALRYVLLTNAMRKDLKIKEIHNVTSRLLSPKDWIRSQKRDKKNISGNTVNKI